MTLDSRKKKVLLVIAALGLISSAAIHLIAFAGVDPERLWPQLWVLHILIIVTFFPAAHAAKMNGPSASFKEGLKRMVGNAPRWMKILLAAMWLNAISYALFGFVWGNSRETDMKIINGQKVLYGHGKIIREVTDKEYELHRARSCQGISTLWMFFFTASGTILYSNLKSESPNIAKRTPAPPDGPAA